MIKGKYYTAKLKPSCYNTLKLTFQQKQQNVFIKKNQIL